MYEFYVGTKVFYGTGSRSVLARILNQKGWSNIGLVIDHNITGLEIIKKLIADVEQATNRTVIEQCTISEPTYEYLESIKGKFQNKDLRVVIGVGGGSTLDTAKAMAVLVNNQGPALNYRGFDKMTEPVLPIIALPTTAGTGSEVTPNASFIDTTGQKKMGINGEAVRPEFALLDPELTLSCPKSASISAGIDSMVHAIEAFAAKKSNPIARMCAIEGFKNVFGNLPSVIKDLGNIAYRNKVMYGAFMSGLALMHSGTGPAAAMSYPLSVRYKVPHGIGGGVFLPHVVKFNVENGFYRYAEIFDSLNQNGHMCQHGEKERSFAFVEQIFSVWQALSVPDSLVDLGIKPDDTDSIVAEVLELKGALDQNPVSFEKNEILSLLNALK